MLRIVPHTVPRVGRVSGGNSTWVVRNLRTTTCRNVNRFRGGLVFKAHRLVYHSTLGLRVINKKKKTAPAEGGEHFGFVVQGFGFGFWGFGFWVLGFGVWGLGLGVWGLGFRV